MKKKGKGYPPFARAFLRTIFVMKFIVLLLLITSTQLVANTTYGQQVTIRMNNVSFKQVTKEIEKQTHLTFLYNDLGISKLQRMDVNVVNKDYVEVLEQFLAGSDFSYRNVDNTVVIVPKTVLQVDQTQQIIIKGRVTDSLGKALPGVTIHIKGTKTKVFSNADGLFQISTPAKDALLVFSFVGKQTRELLVNNNATDLIVVLKDAEITIKEFVVTGYNNIKKESFTGSYTQISKEQLMRVSNGNFLGALQVFDPSFRIMDNKNIGSNPNELPEFYIRGQSGFPGVKELDQIDGNTNVSQFALKNNPNLPIFIMDGFEVKLEKVYDLNLNRINQITILKDAAATAMYGSRASNGVIVIETIAPKPGEFRISYNTNLEITAPDLSSYNMMNAQEKLDAEVAAGVFTLPPETPRDEWYEGSLINQKWLYLQKKNEIQKGVDTYWLSQPLSTMFNQRHSLYLEGGNEAIRLGLDFRYDKQNGVMKQSSRDKIGAGLTVEYRFKGLQIRNQTFFDVMRASNSPYGSFGDYTKLQPYYSIYDDEGEMIKVQPYYQGLATVLNPIYEATLASFSKNKYNEWTNNFSANWFINPYLTIKGQFAIVYNDGGTNKFIDPKSSRFSSNSSTDDKKLNNGELDISSTQTLDWNSNFFGAYNRVFDQHSINFSSGFNVKSLDYNYMFSQYRGFPSGSLNSPSYANRILNKPVFSDNKTRLFGSFTNLNYTFQNIYLFDASFRVDGSSEFGAEKRWAPFWSLGTGMNLHNLIKNPSINVLRIKGNIGQTGKSNFSPYMASNTHQILLDDWYPTGIGSNLIYMGNSRLTWEKQLSSNIGADISFKNRFNLEINYYRKKTYDLISDVSIPASSGFSVYRDNIGKVLNKGFEFNGNFGLLKDKNWDVVFFGNLAHNKNTILEIAESLKTYNNRIDEHYAAFFTSTYSNAWQFVNQTSEGNLKYIKPIRKYEEGSSLTAIYGMRSLGINPANGQEVFLKRNGEITSEWSPYEQQLIGDTEPVAQGAFGLNVRFKQFSVYTSFLYSFGGDAYNETLVRNVENVNLLYYNADRRVLTDRWQKPGDVSQFKSIQDRVYVTRPTSRFIQKNNYVVFNSFSLNYDVNASFIQKYKLNSLRIGFNMNDIARFSTIKEERGLDYPFARTFSFSLNTTF